MRYLAMASVLGLAITTAGAADARSWTRQGQVVGPKGGVTSTKGGGSCANGVCTWGSQAVGPAGRVYTRSGTATRTAPGTWETSGTYVGPRGGTATRTGTINVTR